MTVLKVEPGKEPELVTIDTALESLQEQVGGYIQVVYPYKDNIGIICNDEGKINGMKPNRALYSNEGKGKLYDVLFGIFLVAGLADDSFCSLSQDQITRFTEMFKMPEMFLMENGKVRAVPIPAEYLNQDTLKIYQIREKTPEKRDLMFASYSELEKTGKTVNVANYSEVYSSKYNGESLDSIFERFNLYHLDDFRGHSLSVSDVIVINQNGVDTAYYVDSFGFKQVPEFFASNPLEKVEELLEDDYGMIDGIINNGSRKEEDDRSKKPSILEKLEEKKQESLQLQKDAVTTEKTKNRDIDLS